MFTDVLKSFDFTILSSPDFKEDSVREEIISPLLKNLGYDAVGLNQIVRSKTLKHPFINIGSTTRKIHIIPDYLLLVEGKPAWILDAKAPDELIQTGANVEQAYSYAIHPEIRATMFALCNGKEFIVFRIDDSNPIMYFQTSEIEKHWGNFYALLTPEAFKLPKAAPSILKQQDSFDYNTIRPLNEIKDLKKQSAKRHFGVHPYFTRQVWNVVQEYIKNFSQPGDIVLDPFGGSGVTLIESLILKRKGIHIDINPLSVFLTQHLITPIDATAITIEFERIKRQFAEQAPKTEQEIELALNSYPYPKGISLPSDSDRSTVDELFTPQQLAQLAYLKYLIKQVYNEDVQGTLLLMFSGLLNKINLTYHASSGRSEGRGDSGVFRYYRYRIAKKPANLDIMTYFESRFKKVLAAKREIAPFINNSNVTDGQVYQGSATKLDRVSSETIDYIYTDPPYGNKIKYLDLSVMWTSWLDLPVTQEDFELEAIEGGELKKSKADYSSLLAQSIEEMYRVLKHDRWMSFVFAHKDPKYWHLIVETAEKTGFEYMGAVQQSNGKTSYKKNRNPFTVLSGQLIINFKKARNPKTIMRVDLGTDIANIVMETIESIIARNEGATLEEINDELIIKGLELGFLDLLSKHYQDVSPILNSRFTYDEKTKRFHIPENSKFKSRIDIHLRIRYFLISYLRRMEKQHHDPNFDEIILNVMPLLKNGITPENQTILNVLEDVAFRTADESWKLKSGQQLQLL